MRLEQKKNGGRGREHPQATKDAEDTAKYPSPRYFQIHFQYLHELIEALKEQVQESNRLIAAQNEIIKHALQQSEENACAACRQMEKPNPATETYLTVQKQVAQ
jgi:hypothetical protein